MKNIRNLFILTLAFLATACEDLKIQKPYNFVPEKFDEVSFEDQTMWEFLQTQKTPAGAATLDNFKLDMMIEAIEYTGLVEEYNRPGDARTFLLLNNSAFTGSGQIKAALSGKTTTAVTALDKARLTNLLKYHIIESVVYQVPTLEVFLTDYFFQSLIPGEEGKVSMSRNERYSISVNGSTALPVTKKSVTVRTHNLRVKNGVAHITNGYARYKPF